MAENDSLQGAESEHARWLAQQLAEASQVDADRNFDPEAFAAVVAAVRAAKEQDGTSA